MNRSLWWRFLALSVVFSLLLSLLYVLLVRETTHTARAAIQRSIMLFIARSLEGAPPAEAMGRLDALLAESPEMPRELWILDAHGRLLASRTGTPLPPLEGLLDAALARHEVRTTPRGWLSGQQLSVARLDTPEPRFVLSRNSGVVGRPILRFQSIFFVGSLVVAMFLGLSLVTLYLRGRSHEARQVIARLEAGDLQARFRADRLDAIGALMLDFNRMADEIARLVQRLQTAEDARRALLQDLGHDLRTPLTSLRTSIDTVTTHGAAMPEAERAEFFAIIRSELDYFVRLIDDLFFIADIAEPRYRRSAERVDVAGLLGAELRAAQSRRPGDAPGPALEYTLSAPAHQGGCEVVGDRMLLSRLLRNGLDNATKHARRRVHVAVQAEPHAIELRIEDDRPGIDASQIASFGRRRTQRLHSDAARPSLSLGLGSVIMKTIVDLHGGELAVSAGAQGDGAGTRLTIRLPREA
ncbi:MAG TPA: HAMP domain-containing sensor histidine kinase [Albitalea sp.]|nr:HAMP domain-containing sensor histidine kinase [Albitalea sp.]